MTNPTCDDCSFALTTLECPTEPFSGSLTYAFDGNDYNNGLAPGNYVHKYTVSTGGSDTELNPSFEVTFTLNDPCDNPSSFTKPSFVDQNYVIGTTPLTYTHPDFPIEPDFC